ncbi:MarR family transcriptional regulator [Sinomonas sp. R1AF57]|nr:MarR family transcriptional regulator [Sinomonas sp. R1AF57]
MQNSICLQMTLSGKDWRMGAETAQRPSEAGHDDVEAVLRASRALLGIVASSLSNALESVSLPQFRVLVVLASCGPTPIGALAGKLGSVPSTFSRFLDRMEEAELVERQPSPDSRREVLVALRPKGAAIVQEATERRRAAIAEILQRAGAGELAIIVEGLGAFSVAAGEPAPETLIVLGL